MTRQIGGLVVVLALVALTATACGRTAMARFYTLDSVATPDAGPLASYGVVVGPVTVPSSVDRPEFVVQVTPNRVAVDEFNRWAGPLDESIARVVAGDLTTQLGTPRVAAAPAGADGAARTLGEHAHDLRKGDRPLEVNETEMRPRPSRIAQS